MKDSTAFDKFLKEKDRQRSQNFMSIFLLAASILLFILIVISIFFGMPIEPDEMPVFTVLLIVSILTRILNNRGNTQLAGLIHITFVLISMSWLINTGHGVYDSAILSYFVLLLFAGFILSENYLIAVFILCLILLWTLAWNQHVQHIKIIKESPLVYSFVYTAFLILSFTFILLYKTNIKSYLRQLKFELDEQNSARLKNHQMIENLPAGYFRSTTEGSLLDANPALLQIFRVDNIQQAREAMKHDLHLVWADASVRESIIDNLKKGAAKISMQTKFHRADGTVFTGAITMRMHFSNKGEPLILEGILEDIEEKVRIQEMLIQNEKMTTVAGLAAGMAHEINNPLGIIMQTSENALRRLTDSSLEANQTAAAQAGIPFETLKKYIQLRAIDTYINEIHDAGSRAAKIVANMLSFSRRSESAVNWNSAEKMLEQAVEFAGNDFELKLKFDFKKVQIIREFDSSLLIPCTETAIVQVLLNLIKNASQAMQTKIYTETQPALILRTRKVDNTAVIEIEDNGPGMADDVLKKIFEPFYTTKDPGSGTGLGLSVSYYIITNSHGGNIRAETRQGHWTRFTIELPLTKKIPTPQIPDTRI